MAILAAGLAGLARPLHATSEAGVCTFGVFPYVPALKIGELFAPMTVEFGTALGVPIQLRTNETFEKFEGELAVGSYDITLVHPFLYVDAHQAQGYRALTRVDQDLRGVIVSRRSRPINSLADLRGEKLALPPRGAGVSYLLRLAMLEENLTVGVDLRLRYHQTKVSCLHAVATGVAVGCVVPSFLGDQLHAISEMQLVPIWQSRSIAGLMFATCPRLPEAARIALAERMIGWQDAESGRALLAQLTWPRLLKAEDADFDAVRLLSAQLNASASG
jgi:phosphonate transport system substrate-binding protein